MSKADRFLCLLEGFKLGSLGAGKKIPKDTLKANLNNTEEPFKVLDVDGVGKDYIFWSQTIEKKWLRWFRNWNKWEGKDTILQSCYLYFELSSEDKDEGPFRRWFPRLRGSIRRKDTKLIVGDLEYQYLEAISDTKSEIDNWISKQTTKIKQTGLKALNFPDDWREMWL
jgi:hypothetical protein